MIDGSDDLEAIGGSYLDATGHFNIVITRDDDSFLITPSAPAVHEPSTVLTIGMGLAGATGDSRRRWKRVAIARRSTQE